MAAMDHWDFFFLTCILVSTVATVYFNYHRRPARQKLPPGPKGIPFFGNMFQLPVAKQYRKLREWALQYGDIYYFRIGPLPVVVLNSAEAADELFINRSQNFSSRIPPHVAHDIVSDGQAMAFLPYGAEWKAARRALQNSLGPGPSKALRVIQELEARVLLYDFLCHNNRHVSQFQAEGPHGEIPDGHWFAIIRRYTTSIILNLMYGARVHKLHDNPELHKLYDILANLLHVAQAGRYLADTFPILRRLPNFLAPWRTEARNMHDWEFSFWRSMVDDCRAAMQKGTSRESFVSDYLQKRAGAGAEDAPGKGITDDGWMRDKFLAYTAGGVLEAGSDSTAVTIQSFILFMLSHPRCIRQAQEELDKVIGANRLPGFEDMERLPYVVACIKETLRRRPTTPMGLPHASLEDDFYRGYFIPKGSVVIGNVWAMHMDPKRYVNPTAFDPDRFYADGKLTQWGSGPGFQDRDHYIFGWGRRYCQGSHIAEQSLFIVLSRLLWGFNFNAPLDLKTGQLMIPDVADEDATWTDGTFSGPHVFPVAFTARSDKHAEVIRKAYEDAQIEWQALGLAVDLR
ncbi:cytochrome P450 [Laetiporus sulphureus 93-53]|uniref:Cytochrome P450 n=1 Tax=Laetiporus sulphureus 93-53 TaxID=1314785 RepID=A0A165BNI8_9APHY|nr:cytochrome P450 [Laetiporus sulphureus 93-53]KZT01367.1 cytochrome P450 [Laetiporus sulphureus 93-53]